MRINKVEVHDEIQDTWMECQLRSVDSEKDFAVVKYPEQSGIWKGDEVVQLRRVRGPSVPSSDPLKPGEAVEVLTSSSDDEPFSWWGASVLGVMPNDAVVVAYQGWDEDYNDIFDIAMVRRANTSPRLSEYKQQSRWCVIKINPCLRGALATGRLNFCSDPSAATLELEEGVVMHVSEKGQKLVLMGASKKLEKKMKGIVRHLAARASAMNLVNATNYLSSTPPGKFSRRDFLAYTREGVKSDSELEEKYSAKRPAVEMESKMVELKSTELSESPKLVPMRDPSFHRSLAIDVPINQKSRDPLVATSWSVSSLDDLDLSDDDSLTFSSSSTTGCNSLATSPSKMSFANDPWTTQNRFTWVS